MLKSFSLRDLQNATPFHSQGQPYLKPIPNFEEYLVSEPEKKNSEIVNTESQGSLSPTLPLDKSKKRIKLRVNNQNFPQDFFDTQGEDMINEEKKTYFLKAIPVRVIRSPATKYKRNIINDNSKLHGDNSSFRSQMYNYLNTEERDNSPSRTRNVIEGQDATNRITEILNSNQVRSKSTEPGSAGPDPGHRRSKSPFIMKRRVDEGGQNYIPFLFPSVYPEHEVRSASGMKRPNRISGISQRKDQMTTFRRPRNLVFNSCEDERSPENKPVAPESSHMLVSDSYCWNADGYAQPDQNDKKSADDEFQAFSDVKKEPTNLIKSYSRDSLRRDYESLGFSKPIHHGHYHSVSREQPLIPIGSSRKIMQITRTEEADNLTTERDLAAQFYSIDNTQGTERNVLSRQSYNRGPVNFHKILLKSIGVNAFDGAAVQQRQPFDKQVSRITQKESSKENEHECVKKTISEQKKYSLLGAPRVLKEGLDFSFSKEYSKQENNDTVTAAPLAKEEKEGVWNPEHPEPSEYRSVGSRSQARIKKKFVLIKRE